MLAAIAAPSSALRAKDVVIVWSPLGFPSRQTGRGLCRRCGRQRRSRCRCIGKAPDAVLDWRAPGDGGFGLSGAVLIHSAAWCLSPNCDFCHSLHPPAARPDCPASPHRFSAPPDVRHQESALDRHAAAGLERPAALHVLCRAVRAFFQYRRTRSGRRRAVSRRDELDPYRHHHARPLRRHLHHGAARQAPGARDQ